jgi:hypothetical protein
MKSKSAHKPIVLWCLATFAVASAGIGCATRYDRTEVVDEHGYQHQGYYDDQHAWHGGYYDENHLYHDDPQDWHR